MWANYWEGNFFLSFFIFAVWFFFVVVDWCCFEFLIGYWQPSSPHRSCFAVCLFFGAFADGFTSWLKTNKFINRKKIVHLYFFFGLMIGKIWFFLDCWLVFDYQLWDILMQLENPLFLTNISKPHCKFQQ